MQAQHVVILTGAGISAESGITTFRDEGGLWAQHRIEDVATPEAFVRNPKLVHDFYNARRAQLPAVDANAAHIALGRLQKAFAEAGRRVTLITQNVDDLHERGGAADVIHMHGELNKIRCGTCGTVADWHKDCGTEVACLTCHAKALRPHIVWFGEMPMYMDRIADALEDCDLFVSIGTSGAVYPAAGFVAQVRAGGRAHTVEINLEPSDQVSYFQEHRHGRAGDLVPDLVEELLATL